jgi:hypothetical protein
MVHIYSKPEPYSTCVKTHSNQETVYEQRISTLSRDFEQYKIDAQREKAEMQQQMKQREEELYQQAMEREAVLKEEISVLEEMLLVANSEVEIAKNMTQVVSNQRDEIQSQFNELRGKYVEDSIEWEDRLETEQDARKKDQQIADQVLAGIKEQHLKQLREAKEDGRLTTEAVRSELTTKLYEKETVLQHTELALKRSNQEKGQLSEYVERLEFEREDLPSLSKQTAKVATKKMNENIQKAKNFFRRDRLG